MEAGHFDPPWVRELAGELKVEEDAMRLLERKLARLGLLHQVVKDLFYPDAAIQQLAKRARQLQDEQGAIKAAAWRDHIGIGRKRSIQLLEYFDRIGFTRRIGDQRKIREDSALAQAPKP
jgi:selenocysteine-specific elongation factor